MNEQLKSRIAGIQAILMAHHSAGAGMANETIGNEREYMVREFLAKILPPPFRFGSGVIIDTYGTQSGQLDVVVEWPFVPSFPTPGAHERLYLAESVAFAAEVKSHLSEKWQQVRSTAKRVLALRRRLGTTMTQTEKHILMTKGRDSSIPVVAIGYEGYATSESLKRAVLDSPEEERPNVALVVKSGAYFNRVGGERMGDGEAGVFSFCSDIAFLARNLMGASPELHKYIP